MPPTRGFGLSATGRLLLLVSAFVLVLAAIACSDQHPELESARNAFERGDYDLAIQHYTNAINSGELSDDVLGTALYDRGVAYWEKRLYDEAIRDYSEAIRLNPDSASYFKNRGRRRTGSDDSRSSLAALPSAGPTGSSSKLKPFSSLPTRSACPSAPISV